MNASFPYYVFEGHEGCTIDICGAFYDRLIEIDLRFRLVAERRTRSACWHFGSTVEASRLGCPFDYIERRQWARFGESNYQVENQACHVSPYEVHLEAMAYVEIRSPGSYQRSLA